MSDVSHREVARARLRYGRNRTWSEWAHAQSSVASCNLDHDPANVLSNVSPRTYHHLIWKRPSSSLGTLEKRRLFLEAIVDEATRKPAVRLYYTKMNGECRGSMFISDVESSVHAEYDFELERWFVHVSAFETFEQAVGLESRKGAVSLRFFLVGDKGDKPEKTLRSFKEDARELMQVAGEVVRPFSSSAPADSAPHQDAGAARASAPGVRFQITRHAYSCNNDVTNPAEKDMDPSLTLTGVLGAKSVRESAPSMFDAETVYVSCLIRTWQTAVILYGFRRDALTLVVSPHVTEFLKYGFTRGNRPLNNSPYETSRASVGAMCRNAASQVCKMTEFLQIHQQFFTAHERGNFTLRVRIPGVIEGELTFEQRANFRVAVDAALAAPPSYTDEHNQDGDIERFLLNLSPQETFAHCVAHSSVMKAFVDRRELSGEQERVYADVKQQKQNVWSVRGSWTRGEEVRIDEIHSGVRAEDVRGEWYAERNGRDRALCGYG